MAADETLNYYNANAKTFVEGTLHVDFSNMQNKFLSKIEPGAFILDLGCGSGRDTKYFLEKGYLVDAADGSAELCKLASEYTGIPVRRMYFQDLQECEKYDAIWACSSILHLSRTKLAEVMRKMAAAVKANGIIYTSFKYGTFAGVRNGRYFTDMTEESLQELLEDVKSLTLEEMWITTDVRPGREEEKWLNLFLRRKQ